jgi:hypothetical protein
MILHSGILGKGTKKIGNVVGANWKNRNYVRSFVIPANPNSDLQKVQRALMTSSVAFAKAILGQVLQPYVDPFQRGMSGYNYFIKKNIKLFTDPPSFDDVKVTWGQLFAAKIATCQFQISPYTQVAIGFYNDNGVNGKQTDGVSGFLWDKTTGIAYFPAADALRSTSLLDIQVPPTVEAENLVCYFWTYRLKNLICTMVSDSQYSLVTPYS